MSLVIGGIVGWLASMVMKTNAQMGWIANVLVGVLGSALGFWLAGMFGQEASGGIVRFAIAIAGAALLIFILSLRGGLPTPAGVKTAQSPPARTERHNCYRCALASRDAAVRLDH